MSIYEPIPEPPPLLSGRDELGRAPRQPWVWYAFWVVFGLFVLLATVQYFDRGGPSEGKASQEIGQERAVKLSVAPAALASRFTPSRLAGDSEKRSLQEVLNRLTSDGVRTESEARAIVALSREVKTPVSREAIDLLAKSKERIDQDTLRLARNQGRSVNPEVFDRAEGASYYERILAVQAREARGDSRARSSLANVPVLLGLAGLMGLGFVAGFVGLVFWVTYPLHRLPMRGFPWVPVSLGDADRWAFRALLIFVAWAIGSGGVAVGLRFAGMNSMVAASVAGILLTLLAYGILRTFPIFGFADTKQMVMGEKQPILPLIGWGTLYYCATIPIFVVLAIIFGAISRFFPEPSHPVSELLSSTAPWYVLVAVFVAAAVVAPLWEELCFRGYMAPAMTKLFGSVWVGILVSSCVFAFIHPQGPIMAPVLAGIGAMCAFASYRTGSLIPAIVLHALHNGALVTMMILIQML